MCWVNLPSSHGDESAVPVFTPLEEQYWQYYRSSCDAVNIAYAQLLPEECPSPHLPPAVPVVLLQGGRQHILQTKTTVILRNCSSTSKTVLQPQKTVRQPQRTVRHPQKTVPQPQKTVCHPNFKRRDHWQTKNRLTMAIYFNLNSSHACVMGRSYLSDTC